MQYILIRSKNRRRSVAMQMSPTGELIVRAPVLMPKFIIDRFVAGHTDWITRQVKKASLPKPALSKHFNSPESLEKFVKTKVIVYSSRIGLYPTSLRFSNVKSYWGSCSPAGVISFNHHLIYAPKEAVEYVIVHELCHLKYRGHGKRFWDMVTKYFPKVNDMRRELRKIVRH
jgi:predicted metal-dependent hydrolase